jgi:hypothetical protein
MFEVVTHSPELNELAEALAMAQGEIRDAARDAENRHLKNSYADLTSIWNACRQPLSSHGLSVVQMPLPSEDGKVALSTMLLHKSGQWIRSVMTLPLGNAAGLSATQVVGSALTYARRYALSAVAGVAPAGDDDDGNGGGPASPQPATRPAAGSGQARGGQQARPANTAVRAASDPKVGPQIAAQSGQAAPQANGARQCVECGRAMTSAQYEFAVRSYGRALCPPCRNAKAAANAQQPIDAGAPAHDPFAGE